MPDDAKADLQTTIQNLDLTEELYRIVLSECNNDLRIGDEYVYAVGLYHYAAEYDQPRPKSDIAEEMDLNENKLYNKCSDISEELGIEPKHLLPDQLVSYLVSCLDLEDKAKDVERDTRTILHRMNDQIASGKPAKSVAGSAIHLAMWVNDIEHIKDDVSDTLGFTGVTLRNITQEILEDLDMDEEFSVPNQEIEQNIATVTTR